ncbi:hypothetical protein [Viridibacterium curvum]|uniref:hypothetical protein n=1 Tax=Viridibacterium curvum TaxID=1101404 RepID=UPI0031EB900C
MTKIFQVLLYLLLLLIVGPGGCLILASMGGSTGAWIGLAWCGVSAFYLGRMIFGSRAADEKAMNEMVEEYKRRHPVEDDFKS